MKHESPRRGLRATSSETTESVYPKQPTRRGRIADLEARIAGILRGDGDDPVVPLAIREVDRLRSAAVAIVDEKLDSSTEQQLLVRLLEVAKRTKLPWLAAGAILEELRPDDPRPVDSRPYSTRARQLRRAGYAKCPVCSLDVLDEGTLERLERADREWLAKQALVSERREQLRRKGAA